MRVSKRFQMIAVTAVHLAWISACAEGSDGSGSNESRGAMDAIAGSPAAAGAPGAPLAPTAGSAGSAIAAPQAGASGNASTGALPTSGAGGAATAPGSQPAAGASAGAGGAEPPAAGMGGTAGAAAGSGPVAGMSAGSGAAGSGAAGTGTAGAATDPPLTGGTCCGDGNCICRDDGPELTSRDGPYRVSSVPAGTVGTIFYPSDAEEPFAGLAIIPGFLNSGPEMRPWCDFYASHGIVCTMTNSLPTDIPQIRAVKLLDGVKAMKDANMDSGSPLFGKMSGRYATSGYSMGGGGTTIAAGEDSSLKASVGLAAWGGVGQGVTVPTLLLCGSSDIVAPCTMSSGVYTAISGGTPKMQVTCALQDHLSWFGPSGCSGPLALAFMKRYLDGDERWESLLSESVAGATVNDKSL